MPGNHDLERRDEHFTWSRWKPEGKYEDGHRQGELIGVPSEKYIQRFDLFRRFYHTFYSNKEYPLQAERQFEVVRNGETGLVFLCLNSAWKVDEWRPERAELNIAALDSALMECGTAPLGILVWHHAAAGDRKIRDTRALQRLGQAGFRVLLHGDVHEERDDVLGHLDPAQRIHAVGGGAFGAAAKDRPESTPRLYSVLEVARDLGEVRVMRRHQRSAEGPYGEYAIYRGSDGAMRGEYRIAVPQ